MPQDKGRHQLQLLSPFSLSLFSNCSATYRRHPNNFTLGVGYYGRYLRASSLSRSQLAGFSNSLGFDPSGGPTRPSRSIMSISAAARP